MLQRRLARLEAARAALGRARPSAATAARLAEALAAGLLAGDPVSGYRGVGERYGRIAELLNAAASRRRADRARG